MNKTLHLTSNVKKLLSYSKHKNPICLLLNGPKTSMSKFERDLWNASDKRVTVDGGVNIYTRTKGAKPPSLVFLGDSDSANNDVNNNQTMSQRTIRDKNQDLTDFHKCIEHLKTEFLRTGDLLPGNALPENSNHSTPPIYVLASNSMSRFDHIINQLAILHQYRSLDINYNAFKNFDRTSSIWLFWRFSD